MEVNGSISIEPQDDWLSMTRLKSVSTEDMKRELGKVKGDQSNYCKFKLIYLKDKMQLLIHWRRWFTM